MRNKVELSKARKDVAVEMIKEEHLKVPVEWEEEHPECFQQCMEGFEAYFRLQVQYRETLKLVEFLLPRLFQVRRNSPAMAWRFPVVSGGCKELGGEVEGLCVTMNRRRK
jgi:hypothetical protein